VNNTVDMIKLVRDLPSRPRGRACIVHTHNYEEQKEWANELARQTSSDHIDLLEFFIKDQTLGKRLGEFQVNNLFNFLKSQSNASVLIISGIDFLKATWTGQANTTEQFGSLVENWNQSPCLLFVLQYDQVLATREFRRFPQYTFMVDQRETLAL
jgi:hypothetical protein